MKIYIVVPAHNEAKRIGRVLFDLKKTKLPVIVVDDGSKDKTYQVAKRYGFLVLRHEINLGKGAAMKTGAIAAFRLGADAVVFMDSDGQHQVSDLPKFINVLRSGKFDVVFGVRDMLKVPFIRRVGNSVASILVNYFFSIRVLDLLCGYRAITRKAFSKIEWYSNGYSVETEMVALTGKNNLKHCEIPVSTVYYDKFKGLTPLEGLGIIADVIKWRIVR
jgi:glycosyltransferase involved in cell wall biosynthesis